ncbi:MAG: thiaminase II [Desulfurococcales archaeon]|nr:thiaminase II [Desulfurococcales archaeon]
MRLSEILRRNADSIWSKLLDHPFVSELYSGSLPLEKFRFYAVQDYNYLIGLIRALSIAASKADYEVMRLALSHASFLASTEMANYEKLLRKLGLSLREVIDIKPAPTNTAYVNFMIATCGLGSPLECLVSLLPCYWSYREIALHNKDKLDQNGVDIYREWAQVYLSSDYGEAVEEFKRIIDDLWEREKTSIERLDRIFKTASRYEYMFWDMAYKLEEWPV